MGLNEVGEGAERDIQEGEVREQEPDAGNLSNLGHLIPLTLLEYRKGDCGGDGEGDEHDDQERKAASCVAHEVPIRDEGFLRRVLHVVLGDGIPEEVGEEEDVHEAEAVEEVVHAVRMHVDILEEVHDLGEVDHVQDHGVGLLSGEVAFQLDEDGVDYHEDGEGESHVLEAQQGVVLVVVEDEGKEGLGGQVSGVSVFLAILHQGCAERIASQLDPWRDVGHVGQLISSGGLAHPSPLYFLLRLQLDGFVALLVDELKHEGSSEEVDCLGEYGGDDELLVFLIQLHPLVLNVRQACVIPIAVVFSRIRRIGVVGLNWRHHRRYHWRDGWACCVVRRWLYWRKWNYDLDALLILLFIPQRALHQTQTAEIEVVGGRAGLAEGAIGA